MSPQMMKTFEVCLDGNLDAFDVIYDVVLVISHRLTFFQRFGVSVNSLTSSVGLQKQSLYT